ncbi:MAG: hypothetical protein IJ391_00265 [Clostridia bacterium]|nr:hypothetical protein [Clostridia bacterium]
MQNRCRRCNKPLKNEDAIYGWRCAEILGVSEFLSMADYDTFAKFTEGIMHADKLYKNSNLELTEAQMNALYTTSARMELANDENSTEKKIAKQDSYSILDSRNTFNETLQKKLIEAMVKSMIRKEILRQNVQDFHDNKDDYYENVEKYGFVDGTSKNLSETGVLDDLTNAVMKWWDKSAEKQAKRTPFNNKILDENGKLLKVPFNVSGKENYLYNQDIDMSEYDGFINGQGVGNVAKLKYGTGTMNKNGCGVIAAYNALVQLDDRVDIRDIAAEFEADGKMLNGTFGTNPYAIGRYFESRGYSVEKVEGDRIVSGKTPKSDVYILSYWNSDKVSEALHTVAIRNTSDGKIEVFNVSNKRLTSMYEDSIVTHINNGERQPILLLAISKHSD